MYNKDKIKNSLSIYEIVNLLDEFGAEPQVHSDTIVSKTICHNGINHGSHKLYYYNNTKLFHCYTGCSEPSFDIFELVLKILKQLKEREYTLYDAVVFVAKFYGLEPDRNEQVLKTLEDWHILQQYEEHNNFTKPINKENVLSEYSDTVLQNLPTPIIKNWENEGISREVIRYNHIAFDPASCSIIIPHYDINNRLIGIRQRTLIEEEEYYGKYRPAYINNCSYKHPLGLNLYNINNSYKNIQSFKTAIVFESEKSPLLYQSYFGIENDITVAVCGFNLLRFQFQMLMKLNVKEIVIAFDKQFKETGDEEWKELTKKYYKMNDQYGSYVKLSFIFDSDNLLDYKDSPIDKGRETFLRLFKERRTI
jgi:hypothetical protein